MPRPRKRYEERDRWNGRGGTDAKFNRYRRVIPKALRTKFGGKAEFVRSLDKFTYAQAHAEYERIASSVDVQPVAPEASHDIDTELLRMFAATSPEQGGDVIEYAKRLEQHAADIRSRIALGVVSDRVRPMLEQAAKRSEAVARAARGEKPDPVVTLKAAAARFLLTVTAASTLKVYKPRLADIVAALGEDRDVRSITRAECRSFAQQTVFQIPVHWRKRFPGRKLADVLYNIEAKPSDVIQHETRKGMVTLMKRFFRWCEEEELIEASPANHAPSPRGKRGTRSDFSGDQLKLIFHSAPYKPDTRDDEPGWFWVPLLGLFSGARRDELVMLSRDDLKVERGVHYFDLKEDPEVGRTLKTASSIRKVPLHRALIKIGFLAYAETVPSGSWLFPDLHTFKRPGDHFGKRYGEHLDALGITGDEFVFHSFRHGFQTAARESGIEERYANKIGGWSTPGVSNRYGRFTLKTLSSELNKLTYDLDLKHLYRR